MNKQETFIDFEHIRAGYKLVGDSWIIPIDPVIIIPPEGSNSFYEVSNGVIDIYTLNDDPDNYKFGLSIDSGIVDIGIGSLQIDGNDNITLSHYKYLNIKENAQLNINNNLTLTRATMSINGTLNIDSLASLILRNNSIVNTSSNSVININKESFIFIDEGSKLNLYGTINIHINKIETILNQSSIYIDPTAVINITGLNNTEREFSLQDYIAEMNSKIVNVNTTQEKHFNNNHLMCKWVDGSPVDNSHSISIYCEKGYIINGDLKSSFLGLVNNLDKDKKILSNLIVNKDATLIIAEDYNNNHYFYPSIYIGVYIDNMKVPAKAIINGTLLIDGDNSELVLDRNGSLIINGTVQLSNNGKLKITNCDQTVITINGTLILDSLEQLVDIDKKHIEFGSKGKIVILNPSTNSDQILLEIPKGIKTSKLYKLFEDRISHVEFHLSEKTGIKIDTYFDNYQLEMKYWFGQYNLIDAIKNGFIVWEDNAFIELDHEIINWATLNSNMFDLIKLFEYSGLTLKDELQSIVDKFIDSNSGNIRFKFIENNQKRELFLNVNIPQIKSVYYDDYNDDFVIQVSSSAYMFLSNNVSRLKPSVIVNQSKKIQPLLTEFNHFEL